MTFIISLILMFSTNVSHIKITLSHLITNRRKKNLLQYGNFNKHPLLLSAVSFLLTSPSSAGKELQTYLIIMFIFIRHETYFQLFHFHLRFYFYRMICLARASAESKKEINVF